MSTTTSKPLEVLFRLIEEEHSVPAEKRKNMIGKNYLDTHFPGIPNWKVYSARRVFAYLKETEKKLGESRFKKKPLYHFLLEKGLTLDAMGTLTQDRFQKAPIAQFIDGILKGTIKATTDYAITQLILSWFEEHHIPLEAVHKREQARKHQEKKPSALKTPKEEQKQPESTIQIVAQPVEEQKKPGMERIAHEEGWKLLRAGEALVAAKDSGVFANSGMTIALYIKERFPDFSRSQVLTAERIVRELTRYQKKIEAGFQFEHRPLYFQLYDAGLSFYTIALFTRERYQLADIPSILKGILKGTIEPSLTVITRLLEEKSKEAIIGSPIPVVISEAKEPVEEKEEDEEEEEIEVSEETPAQDIDSFTNYRIPFQPRRLPLPRHFPPVLMPAPDGKRDAIVRKDQQITYENFDFMKIYVVAQGSNGRLVVSTRRVYKSREHHAWKYNKMPDTITQEDIEASERRAKLSIKPEATIEETLHEIKLEMDQIFRAMYPELSRYPNKRGIYEYPHLISFREIYAWERSDIVQFLKDKGYIVVPLDSSKLLKQSEIKGRSRRVLAH